MTSNDSTVKNLLQKNAKWAQAVVEADPNFFEESVKGQSPQVCFYLSLFAFSAPIFMTYLIGVMDWLFGLEGSSICCYRLQAWRLVRPQKYRQVRSIGALTGAWRVRSLTCVYGSTVKYTLMMTTFCLSWLTP